jgi:hypothetical protein
MQVLNQIDFYERAIYKCQNALMGIFNNYWWKTPERGFRADKRTLKI